jgi:hypothetical protein
MGNIALTSEPGRPETLFTKPFNVCQTISPKLCIIGSV